MARVVHFEIPANEPERVLRFYEDAFGWITHKAEGMDYWLVSTGEEGEVGINGAIFKRSPEWGDFANVIDVESLDSSISAVEQAGGTIVIPKQAVQGVGWVAYFRDPEGNLFGMMEADEAAA